MNHFHSSRRQFVSQTGIAAAGLAVMGTGAPDVMSATTNWSIGCFNRPWGKWSYDEALDELKKAGFKTTGLVGRHKVSPEPLLTPDASADYLKRLKERIDARGLTSIIAWIYGPKAREKKDAVTELKRLTDNAKRLGLTTLLSGGPRRNETVDYYSGVMAEVVPYAADQGIRVAMKPHGGDGAEILRCLELINHRNFSIWYDAGNIIYYTGADPVKELAGIASHVTGFCAKDCGGKGSPVMIQFGTGKVDFQAVFQVLKDAGFNGPVMIECTGDGNSSAQTTRLAMANRDYLKRIFARLR